MSSLRFFSTDLNIDTEMQKRNICGQAIRHTLSFGQPEDFWNVPGTTATREQFDATYVRHYRHGERFRPGNQLQPLHIAKQSRCFINCSGQSNDSVSNTGYIDILLGATFLCLFVYVCAALIRDIVRVLQRQHNTTSKENSKTALMSPNGNSKTTQMSPNVNSKTALMSPSVKSKTAMTSPKGNRTKSGISSDNPTEKRQDQHSLSFNGLSHEDFMKACSYRISKEINGLKDQNKTLLDKIEKLTSKNVSLQNKCNNLSSTVESLNLKLNKKSNSMKELSNQIESTCKTNKELKETVARLERKGQKGNEDLKRANNCLQRDIHWYTTENSVLKAQNKALQDDIARGQRGNYTQTRFQTGCAQYRY